MSLFTETLVQDGIQSRAFKQVKLVPHAGVNVREVNTKSDWIDHEEYLRKTEKSLRAIRPPMMASSAISHSSSGA